MLTKRQYITAMVAASVAVQMPLNMEPMMITGANRAQAALFVAVHFSAHVERGYLGQPSFFPKYTVMSIWERPIRTPGTIPPMKSFPMDSPVMPP